MTEITLNVPQGIGDIFWIYKKFAPSVDWIDFNVMVYGAGAIEVQSRALAFIKTLPKVRTAGTIQVDPSRYERTWKSAFPMDSIFRRLERGYRSFDYGCNAPLERGIRIESIDPPRFGVQETVPLPESDCPLPFERYVVMYVPGFVIHPWAIEKGMWPIRAWVDLAVKLREKFKGGYPIVAIGASYDEQATCALVAGLSSAGFSEVDVRIDLSPEQVFRVLHRAELFVGHQSGLNILADNLDTRQIMLYMNTLDGLRLSWPKQANIDSGRYQSGLFSESPEAIVERVPWHGTFIA